MNLTWLALLGGLSALLSFVAFFPYIRDTLARRTQPQRASWLIWSALSLIALATQIYEGATASLWFIASQSACTIVICGLSISHGKGEFLSRFDERTLWVALIGLIVWYTTETAAYALALVILISMLGGALTIYKSYCYPSTETLSTWVIAFAASGCGVLAVGSQDWILLAYPVYLFGLYALIIGAVVLGRNAQPRSLA